MIDKKIHEIVPTPPALLNVHPVECAAYSTGACPVKFRRTI